MTLQLRSDVLDVDTSKTARIENTLVVKKVLESIWGGSSRGLRVTLVMLIVVAGLIGFIMAFEDRLIYFPSKYPEGFWEVDNLSARAGEFVAKIEDCNFEASDGVRLHGWYCTPHRKSNGSVVPVSAEMTLLWFHGNAGNISYRYEMIQAMMQLAVRVFIIDYRGYGKSEGKPTEQGLYLDARAAWDYLVAERNVAPTGIIIFGKSLGGAPAVDLATQVDPAGLIVQSSFTSAADMAAAVLPFLPAAFLHTRMDSLGKIARVRCPKLFIHSRADEVVPYELGRRLYEAAPEPKQFYEVNGASHNSIYIVGGRAYLDALRSFIESCKQRP
ncbi:MAG TPA: alpha/beta hydrolase [Blastocatellia bacterium]|nr:alpha/beta hydrolase [Blastocatellia bacterium]